MCLLFSSITSITIHIDFQFYLLSVQCFCYRWINFIFFHYLNFHCLHIFVDWSSKQKLNLFLNFTRVEKNKNTFFLCTLSFEYMYHTYNGHVLFLTSPRRRKHRGGSATKKKNVRYSEAWKIHANSRTKLK